MKKGFTLIELLVIIAILLILFSVVWASLSDSKDRKRVQEKSQTYRN